MTEYKRWSHLSVDERLGYTGLEDMGSKFEFSFTCDTWDDKVPFSPFWPNNYYRVKGATSMTETMTHFLHLDPVKQGEILVAFRNGDPNLQQWLWASETWGDVMFAKRIFDDTVYRIKPAKPRECYVGFDKDNRPVSTAEYQFVGSVLMREVMED
jgi:hypothetical protein